MKKAYRFLSKILIIDEVEIRLSLCLLSEGIPILQAFFKSPISQLIKIERGIHILCKRPVKTVLQFRTILAGISYLRNEKTGLPFLSHRKSAPREIENRNILKIEDGPFCNPPSSQSHLLHLHFLHGKFPGRPFRIAGRKEPSRIR